MWAPARGACLGAWVGLGRLLFALVFVVAAFSLGAAMLCRTGERCSGVRLE